MYLDDDPPISAGREIWGFPKKYAHPKLEIVKDTLTGTLSYAGQLVAMGTMGYKHESMAGNGVRTTRHAVKDPDQSEAHSRQRRRPSRRSASSSPTNLTDITVKGSWIGPGRLAISCRMSMRRLRIFRCGDRGRPIISSPTCNAAVLTRVVHNF